MLWRVARSLAGRSVQKVTVIAWDLGHNAVGRAYLLADVLRNRYDVELNGANFPRFGNELWKPLRTCSRVTIRGFPGSMFPEHFRRMEDVARRIDGDVLFVSKAKLPSMELAILAKLHRNRPVILDIDDYEPGFHANRSPLVLEEVRRRVDTSGFERPSGELWTRYCQTLVPLFDGITVSNDELRKRYGGMVVPHVRDERAFDPAIHPRRSMRKKLGLSPEDRVILFVGTPLAHKGVGRIVAALEELNRPDYKLLIIGSNTECDLVRSGSRAARIVEIPPVPFGDLPKFLCAGDLVCLMQDETDEIARFQMPAKMTDALSMGIPILSTNAPPLADLGKAGLVQLLDDTPLARRIEEIFSSYATFKAQALENRRTFLSEYSYSAALPRISNVIEGLRRDPYPIPNEFHELVAYHREVFSGGSESPGMPVVLRTLHQCSADHQSADMI